MDRGHEFIINALERNKTVFNVLLSCRDPFEYSWKQEPGKWNLLEIACHLYDEEREDFRARVKQVLDDPELPFPKIDPVSWVTERNYSGQDYSKILNDFLEERDVSINWLRSLKQPKWENAYMHPKVGPVSANLLLSNWLAHDYLPQRQIIKLKYDHLKFISGEKLDYAGNW
jgi:hypothetical protein